MSPYRDSRQFNSTTSYPRAQAMYIGMAGVAVTNAAWAVAISGAPGAGLVVIVTAMVAFIAGMVIP